MCGGIVSFIFSAAFCFALLISPCVRGTYRVSCMWTLTFNTLCIHWIYLYPMTFLFFALSHTLFFFIILMIMDSIFYSSYGWHWLQSCSFPFWMETNKKKCHQTCVMDFFFLLLDSKFRSNFTSFSCLIKHFHLSFFDGIENWRKTSSDEGRLMLAARMIYFDFVRMRLQWRGNSNSYFLLLIVFARSQITFFHELNWRSGWNGSNGLTFKLSMLSVSKWPMGN